MNIWDSGTDKIYIKYKYIIISYKGYNKKI